MKPLLINKAPAIAEIVDAYLSVRTGWDAGYGKDFGINERAEAVAYAKSKIKPLIYNGEVKGWTEQVSIEERWQVRYIDGEAMGQPSSSGIDMAVKSDRIKLTKTEQNDILAKPECASQLKSR